MEVMFLHELELLRWFWSWIMESTCELSVVKPPISPRSPPGGGLDLYGKRRRMVKVQVLEREISLLQEELKSMEDLQLASKCCKELDDFVGAKSDPFIAVNQETRKSKSFWKRLCGCLHRLQKQNCCACCAPSRSLCASCSCLRNVTCQNCCKCTGLSCLCHAYCCFKSPVQKCKQVNLCSNCAKCCHDSCCL